MAGWRNPPRQDWRETTHPGALTATDEDTPPQLANASAENAQLSRVSRNSVVLVVAQHSFPESMLMSTEIIPFKEPCSLAGLAVKPPAVFPPNEKMVERFFGFFTANH
jgi:hypothetical protein